MQQLAQVDETLLKARANEILKRFTHVEDMLEFYDDARGNIAVQRARLEESMMFESTMVKAIEAKIVSTLEENKSQKLPASGFNVTYIQKTKSEYDPEALLPLQTLIPLEEARQAIFKRTTLATNGTALNKLVRQYGEQSPIGTLINSAKKFVPDGRPKLTIERIETMKSVAA